MKENLMKTDIEIAQSIELQPIVDVVKKIGIDYDDLELFGKYKAKLSFDKISEVRKNPVGKLILVTAINPTPAGEGKSTITIGLADALNKIGKKTMIAIREPSLGPVMGIKASARPMVIVDFPSPAGVGLMAVTRINFPTGLLSTARILSKLSLALYFPYNSKSS